MARDVANGALAVCARSRSAKQVINRSVRDHKQAARIDGDWVRVTSYVGSTVAGRYSFPTSDWADIERQHPNPAWWKQDFIRSLTAQMDEEPGGPDQAERIRGAQVAAIDAACTARRLS